MVVKAVKKRNHSHTTAGGAVEAVNRGEVLLPTDGAIHLNPANEAANRADGVVASG
jgi:hypothetical protein